MSSLLFFITREKRMPPDFSKYMNLILIGIFSSIFSLSFFKIPEIIHGSLYLLRLISYIFFYVQVWNLVKNSEKFKKLLSNSLILVCLMLAVFGWLQYFLIPDTRFLYAMGWDDHYYRLISTFLDPAFTGIILVLGFILTISKFKYNKKLIYIIFSIFLFLSIGFTYSRSSFLALLAGVFTLFPFKKSKRLLIISLLFTFLLAIALPRPSSEGVRLERTKSIYLKIVNFGDSLKIISKSPLFGIGFDNICVARQKYLDDKNINSHSCGGLDNSLLFVFATMGIAGLLIFLNLINEIIKNTSKGIYGVNLKASFVAILVHGMFTNTFFYPWLMGWTAIILALSRKNY
jgi:O-antigen ligase